MMMIIINLKVTTILKVCKLIETLIIIKNKKTRSRQTSKCSYTCVRNSGGNSNFQVIYSRNASKGNDFSIYPVTCALHLLTQIAYGKWNGLPTAT